VQSVHELAVTESLLAVALCHAERSGAARVTDLYLVIGQLSSIVDDSVQFYWDIISQGTIAEHAHLHFQRLPAEFKCRTCEHQFRLNEQQDFMCPRCGGLSVRLIGGDEFRLEAINIEKEA
jgi:hydrogenase nickel incorporation protein HypA/HybF